MTSPQSPPHSPVPGAFAGGSRLDRVLAAHRLVTADLSLTAMIDRLLQAAVGMTGADRGAVVVLSGSGGVPYAAGQHAAAPDRTDWPVVLTAVVSAHGAPLLELHVGAEQRTTLHADAEQLLSALSELAGTALENALLHDEAQRSKDWLQASGEIARALLSDADADTLMQTVLRVLHVAEADTVSLLLPDGDGRLKVAVAHGRGADDFRGGVIEAASSALGRAVVLGESLLVDDLSEIMRDGYVNVHEFGPIMSTPLVDARGVRGAVVLSRRRGRPRFTARDLDLATTFADQLALALEMDDARLRREWTTVLEDRHRIARDLHDNVMQRLFATGVGLQSLAAGALPPDVADRVSRYVAELDDTIDEIRTRVFGLRHAGELRHGPTTARFPRIGADDPGAHTART